MEKVTINFESPGAAAEICPQGSPNRKLIEEAFGIQLVVRDTFIRLLGPREGVERARQLLSEAGNLLPGDGSRLETGELRRIIEQTAGGEKVPRDRIQVGNGRGFIRPRTQAQQEYVRAIARREIVFVVGPAGTGKTYLAVAAAVSALLKGKVRRLILTRPALEAGERLGFLPGDIAEKIGPYLRPLSDAIHDMLDPERLARYEQQGVIEVAPLGFMRGRTLNEAFIILDEAQNCTVEQMKMFLTRLGFKSRMVITGDITQSDLPRETVSGLIQVQDILRNVPDIEFVHLSGKDVVRHPLVQKIVSAYEAKG